LVYLFGLFPPFIDELHNTIKAQIRTGRKSILEVYGDVYYKAWKAATGPYLLKLEYSCIQDLMGSCIHVADTKISNAIRTVVGVFHAKKKQKGVRISLFAINNVLQGRQHVSQIV
jgi:condensin-2 complex subunit G2